jgi:hypothetical protein
MRRRSWRPADEGVCLKEVVPLIGGAGEIQLRARWWRRGSAWRGGDLGPASGDTGLRRAGGEERMGNGAALGFGSSPKLDWI